MTTPEPTVRLGEHNYPASFAALAWIQDDPEGYILALHEAEQLGYLKASDEWLNLSDPLPERLQEIAHRMVAAGQLPDFEDVIL